MLICNNTDQMLYVSGHQIKPREFDEVIESCFDMISIHCDLGSSQIICEYGQREIKNFGNIIAEESDGLDPDNKKIIIVNSK